MTPLVIIHRATLQLGHRPEAPAESWKPRIKSSPSCLLKEAFLALWFKITGTSFQEWFGSLIFLPTEAGSEGCGGAACSRPAVASGRFLCGACRPDLLILYTPPPPHPQRKIAINTLNIRLQAGVEGTPPSRCGSQAIGTLKKERRRRMWSRWMGAGGEAVSEQVMDRV